MPVTGIFHAAIKTNSLEDTVYFYTKILGLRQVDRPNFGFPGAWLGCPTPGGQAIIHIYAGGPALGETGQAPLGTGAIDHIAITATGFHEFCERVASKGLEWREFIVPGTTLWQLFVYDPNGVMLEVTFDGDSEGAPKPDMSEGRAYVAGKSFFNSAAYDGLAARST